MFKTNRNKKESGQGLVEYALILVLVAIVVIAVLMLLGPIIGNVFSTINGSLSSFGGGTGGAAAAADPGAQANAAFQAVCDNRSWPSGTTQTWSSGDVVVYLQNDGWVYTRFSDDSFFTDHAGDVVTVYGTIPAGTPVTCQ